MFLQGEKDAFKSQGPLLKRKSRSLASCFTFWMARKGSCGFGLLAIAFCLFYFSRIRKWHAKGRSVLCSPRTVLSSLSREELAVSVAKVRFPSCCFPLLKMLSVHIRVVRDWTKLGASQLGLTVTRGYKRTLTIIKINRFTKLVENV